MGKIADALGVGVYQLFIPQNKSPVIIEETPENERIKAQMSDEIIENIGKILNKSLDKMKK